MAQRFIIDGNFTQSFVGGVNFNIDACPNDYVIRPGVHYDVGSGDLCYDYDDRICFDYIFDDQHVVDYGPRPNAPNEGFPIRKGQARKGRFQFIGPTRGYPSSSVDISHPTSSVNDTLYILINSESAAGTNLYPYLTRNPKSGSIILRSIGQTVEFEYNSFTSSLTPISSSTQDPFGYGDQIILGTTFVTSSQVEQDNASTLKEIISTRNIPFVHEDRVCIEVRPKADVPPLQDVMEVGSSTTIAISSSADVALSGSGDLIINDISSSNISGSGNLLIGNITASNISASNSLFASLSQENYVNSVVYDTSSGQFYFSPTSSFSAVLLQNLTAQLNESVGGVDNGDFFAAGTLLEDVLRAILIEYIPSSITFNRNGGLVGINMPTVSEVSRSYSYTTYAWSTTVDSNNDPPFNGFIVLSGADSTDTFSQTTPHAEGSNTKVTGKTKVQVSPTTIGSSNSQTVTFTVRGEDAEGVSLDKSFTTVYVYPIFYGQNLSNAYSEATGSEFETQTGFTKLLQTKGNKTVSVNPQNEYIYFAYPSRYGTLAQIRDGNDFDVTGDFTRSLHTLEGNSYDWDNIDYYIYRSNNVTIQDNKNYEFNFTAV